VNDTLSSSLLALLKFVGLKGLVLALGTMEVSWEPCEDGFVLMAFFITDLAPFVFIVLIGQWRERVGGGELPCGLSGLADGVLYIYIIYDPSFQMMAPRRINASMI
jgi:hypothetical protein